MQERNLLPKLFPAAMAISRTSAGRGALAVIALVSLAVNPRGADAVVNTPTIHAKEQDMFLVVPEGKHAHVGAAPANMSEDNAAGSRIVTQTHLQAMVRVLTPAAQQWRRHCLAVRGTPISAVCACHCHTLRAGK